MPDAGLADGSVLTSANYDTYLRQQVVAQVTSGTRPTGVEGRIITETDTDRIVCYDGSSWVRIGGYTSTGRTGVSLARFFTTQTINQNTWTAISWDVETVDTDGFIAVTSDTITIPSGLGGVYMATASVSYNLTPGTDAAIEFYVNGASNGRFAVGNGSQMTSCGATAVLVVAAADTVQVRVYQSAAATRTLAGSLWMYRVAA